MKAIVWSKDNCTYCDQAKKLLEAKGIEFEEKKIAKMAIVMNRKVEFLKSYSKKQKLMYLKKIYIYHKLLKQWLIDYGNYNP